jgi:phage pi2 protein 07
VSSIRCDDKNEKDRIYELYQKILKKNNYHKTFKIVSEIIYYPNKKYQYPIILDLRLSITKQYYEKFNSLK